MLLDANACYRALATHDSRFDGRFFVGVRSTGIYCRPVCTVRMPKRENCRFFASAPAAERDGFRPCLRCRPELAPGYSPVDATARVVQAAVALIDDGFLEERSIEALADRIGVTSRHLRRVFEGELGVSPIAYAQTQRLLLAKRLLTDTSLPVTEVAFASGFASVRRMNALFASRYRLAPSTLRRQPAAAADSLVFTLGYRPPYAWEAMLAFLEFRAIAGVEARHGRAFRRAIAIEQRGKLHSGWIDVAPAKAKPALVVRMSPSLSRVVPQTLARVRHAFDVACDPLEVARALGPLAAATPGLRVPGGFDGFEIGVRAIVGQQISVRRMADLAGRIAQRFGTPLAGAPAPLTHTFPSASVIADVPSEALAALGMPRARAQTLVTLARAVVDGLDLSPHVDPQATMQSLTALRGIGPWTAQYIALRGLGWPDAFLPGDLGVKRALGVAREADVLARAERWRPWRAYAVIHLWTGNRER